MATFDQLLLAILHVCHYQNHKNNCHCSIIENRNLQGKPNTIKLELIFNWNMLLTISDSSYLQKQQNDCHGSTVQDKDLHSNMLRGFCCFKPKNFILFCLSQQNRLAGQQNRVADHMTAISQSQS